MEPVHQPLRHIRCPVCIMGRKRKKKEREIEREGKLKLFPERKHSRKQTQRIGREGESGGRRET